MTRSPTARIGTAVALAAAAAAIAVAIAPQAAAQGPDGFFKDKAVKVMVGHAPGGSFDFYARLAADMLKKHLPGVASVVVENKPGGGGVVAANHFHVQGARDGTQLAVFPETLANMQVFEPAAARWKIEEMAYIGSFAPVNNMFVRRRNAPAKTPEEMRRVESNVGCAGVASQSFQHPALLKSLGGFKFRMVCGYPGSAEYILAMEKGEVDIVSNAWNLFRITHLKSFAAGDLVAFAQVGRAPNRELPDVPMLQDLVADAEAKRVIALVSLSAGIGRALLAPPGVPADRIAFLRGVFDKMVRDPEMIELARKRNLELDPTPGAELQKIVDQIITAPRELIEKAAKAMAG